MPRYSVIANTGRTIAKGLYHLPHLELIGCQDAHSLTPAGSFLVDRDLERSGWTFKAESGIYLSHQDVFELPRAKGGIGCCGPNGSKIVLDPDTMEPIAYEFADCYSAHYIRFARGDFSLEEESPEDPVCMVAYVEYRSRRLLIGAACGRTEKETLFRLMPLAQNQREAEAGCTSQYHVIMELPIGTMSSSDFLRQLHKERPAWLFLKY